MCPVYAAPAAGCFIEVGFGDFIVKLTQALAQAKELKQEKKMIDQKEYRGHGKKADQWQFHLKYRQNYRAFQQ